jgi:2-polyprenyl-3-methyl-5-hydroxy-6-metoxy-1,4-benzoquinol methylase
VKKWVYYSPIFGTIVRYAGYIYTENGLEANDSKIKELIQQGYQIAIFPEGTRSSDGQVKRFHKGAFYLSARFNLPINRLFIQGAHEVNPKGDFMINPGTINLIGMDSLPPTNESNYSYISKSTCADFRAKALTFRMSYADTIFHKNYMLRNYLFKGPILEWYFRIKWRLEAQNYDHYNNIIGTKSTIYDLGCGYGFLSLYLHYRNPNRKIYSFDIDAEKILVAKNCYTQNENLTFHQSDITKIELKDFDILFLNDVLHYLTESEQTRLLTAAANRLKVNGSIIIREGISDDMQKHGWTKLTEFFSIHVFKFNQSQNLLHFPSKSYYSEFALKNNLTVEFTSHSNKTSNTLILFRK